MVVDVVVLGAMRPVLCSRGHRLDPEAAVMGCREAKGYRAPWSCGERRGRPTRYAPLVRVCFGSMYRDMSMLPWSFVRSWRSACQAAAITR